MQVALCIYGSKGVFIMPANALTTSQKSNFTNVYHPLRGIVLLCKYWTITIFTEGEVCCIISRIPSGIKTQ